MDPNLLFINNPWFLLLITILMIWDGVLKAIALWKSARNSQIVWFICLIIINSVGILPLIYLFFFQKSKK